MKFAKLYSVISVFLMMHLQADIKEINAYWAEVSRAVKAGDFEAYKATCHPDGVLVSGSRKTSFPLADALKKWKKEFDDTKAGTRKSSAKFRFSKRYHDATTAYESGVLLYEFSTDEGKKGTEYIFLEALLLKRDGRWQIMMEYQIPGATEKDWAELKPIGE
jgi:ketosteroid isomerase-like protein